MGSMGQVVAKFGADISNFAEGLARMALLSAGTGGLIAAALIGAGVAIVGVGVASSMMAGTFQQGVNRLVTGAGDVTDNMQKMGQSILSISTATGIMTGPLLSSMYQIISAGQRGAQAENTLAVAAKGAVTEQANVVNVAKALTTVMTDYGTKQYNATQYMNGYTRATQLGKLSLEQLSTSLGPILPLAQNLGIHFADVAGAMSTMTNAGIPAEQAATSLRFAFQSLENPTHKARTAMTDMGLSSVAVGNELKVSLPGALEMIYNAAKKAGPEGSVPFNRAVSDMIGGQRSLSAFLALTGTHFKTFSNDARAIADAMNASKTAVLGWDTAQKNFNVQLERVKAAVAAAAISIGTQLLPVLTQIVGHIAPVVIAFAAWVEKTQVVQHAIGTLGDIINKIGAAFNSVFHPVQQVTAALAPLTDSFTRATAVIKPIAFVVNPMLDSFTRATAVIKPVHEALNPMADSFDRATSVMRKTAPVAQQTITVFSVAVAIFHAVATAITFFVGVYQTVSSVITASIPVFQRIWAVLQQVGAFIASTFAPVWAQLVISFHDVMAAIQPILPQLQQLGMLIGGVVVVALVLVVAALAGLATGLAQVLIGVAQFVTGVIQFFSGLVQVVSGLVQLLADLVTGHFDRIGADLDRIMTGILTMMIGVWNMIRGLWTASIGAVIALATGFVMAVINIFIGLYNALVGHSIIPDMINAIVRVFATLAGLVTGPINNAVHTILSILQGAIGLATTAGSNIIKGIANGITAGIHFVAGAISSVVGFIADHLPKSPAKLGPLRDLNKFGPALTHGFAEGIMKGTPEVTAAANKMVGGVPTSGTLAPSGGRNAQSNATYIIQINGQDLIRALGPGLASELRLVIGGV